MSNGNQNSSLQDFVDMSAALTGFEADFLKPRLDPVNLSKLYFDTATEQTASSPYKLSDLLAAYAAVKVQPAQAVANSLLQTGTTVTSQGLLAQSIVKLWYLGSWYPPDPPSGSTDPAMVVTSNGYIGGLAWKIAQAHPMGFSELTFGYWTSAPPPLAEFGAGGGKGGDHG